MLPLLGQGGVVDHEHAWGKRELFPQDVHLPGQQPLMVPGGMADEMLHRLFVPARKTFCHRLHALALPVQQKSGKVDPAPVAAPLPYQVRIELPHVRQQLLPKRLQIPTIHHASLLGRGCFS